MNVTGAKTFFLLLLMAFGSCAAINKQISSEADAKNAFTLEDPHIETYRPRDYVPLKLKITKNLRLYELGTHYLYKVLEKRQKLVGKYTQNLHFVHQELYLLRAQLENLEGTLRVHWKKRIDQFSANYMEMKKVYQQVYRESYKGLLVK